ncbi:MAG TPA: SRPBCC family protein [Tepidisphaeraceae bacterium]|jgi:uncharacterized membrane protein
MTMSSQNTAGQAIDQSLQGQVQHQHTPRVNVGSTERMITGAVGGILALTALRRSLPGLLVAGVGGMLVYRAVSGHCSAYEAMGIDTAHGNAEDGAAPEEYFNRGIHVVQSYTVNRSPEECYNFWRKFENLPRIMRHLESVTRVSEIRSHWVAVGPGGYRVEWDAEIINDEPNELIAWRSLGGADVDNAGSVRFVPAPGNRGTEVRVNIDYIPPAGVVGWAVAKLFGREPKQQIKEDLRHFKQIMETGEVATTEGQSSGTA